MMLRLAMFLLLFSAVTAAAQPATDAPTQSIGAGAQWALPYSGRGEAPGVQVSWRRWFNPCLGVGTEFRWFQTDADERRISSSGLAGGLLARTSAGRLTLIGGAGPGFFVERSRHDTRINGSRSTGAMTFSSVGMQMLMEADVRMTSRLSAFAGLRIEIRDLRSMETSSGYPTAGLRFAF